MLRRRPKEASPRHYLYVSDTKLDMLFEQIPAKLRSRLAAELKVNVKVVSVALTTAATSETRMSKLALVERYLEQHRQVGQLDDGAPYFRGMMRMHWGTLEGAGDSRISFFLGRTRNATVALAGSRKHVVGQAGLTDFMAWSALPNILAVVGEHISAEPGLAESIREVRRTNPGGSEFAAAVFDPPEAALTAVDSIWLQRPERRTSPPPAQAVEFLAKRLVDGNIPSRRVTAEPQMAGDLDRPSGQTVHVTIGTPIYVAQAD
jgi:hypothetical protein